jgi:DNA-binding NarL/FixJ family response regulator
VVKAGSRLRVFLVEDSVIVLERLSSTIAQIGATEIVGHADAEAPAIDAIRRLEPDVVVTDIRLRSGSGIAVVRAAKRMALPVVPVVIVLTNDASGACAQECARAGADHFFDKSRDLHRVARLLGNPLAKHLR